MILPPSVPTVPVDLKGRPLIDFVSDGVRIAGLVWEDRVRTTKLFLASTVSFHPQAATDIPPEFDIRQGLPTHVKSSLTDDIGMASSLRLFDLKGHQRLVVGLYRMEEHVGPDGRKVDVYCFYKVVEIILSPQTLSAMFGQVTIDDIRRIHGAVTAYERHPDTLAAARERFHAMTEEIRPRMGIARSTVKIDANQNRLQSYLSLRRLADQLATEGRYVGLHPQDNYQEFTDDFYGLALPWRTTGRQRIFRQPPDPDKPKRKRKAKPVPPSPHPHAAYLQEPKGTREFDIDGGSILVSRHHDGAADMRTVHTISDSDEVRIHVSRACQAEKGTWLKPIRSWLLDFNGASRVIAGLTKGVPPRPLPPVPVPSIMQRLGADGDLYGFETDDGPARALRMPDSNWVLMGLKGENNVLLKARFSAACERHGVGKLHDKRKSWLIPHDPPHLIEQVAVAIREFVWPVPPRATDA